MRDLSTGILTKKKWRWDLHGVLFFFLLVGGILRFYKLNYQSVWLDEIHTLMEADPSKSWADMYNLLLVAEPHPPLYFALMHVLFSVFGYSTLILRAFSALLGVVSLYYGYRLGKELYSKQAGLLFTGLMSFNYFHLYYSQEGRPYAFLLLFTILSYSALIRFIRTPNWRNTMYYGLLTALMLYGHFFGLFVLFAQYILFAVMLVAAPKADRKVLLLKMAASALLILVLFIPALPLLMKSLEIKNFWIPYPTPDAMNLIFGEFFGSSQYVMFLVSIPILIYFVSLAKVQRTDFNYKSVVADKEVFSFLLLSSWILVVVGLTVLKSYLSNSILISRYFIVLLPAIGLMISIGIGKIRNPIIAGVLFAAMLFASVADIIVTKRYYTQPNRTQFRDATDVILQKGTKGENVVSSLGIYLPYFLKDRPLITQTLDEYVATLRQDPTARKSFWYLDAHGRPYKVTEETQKFLDELYFLTDTFEGYDIFTRHYVLKTDASVARPVTMPSAASSQAATAHNIESFRMDGKKLIVSGWACFKGVSSVDTDMKTMLVKDGKGQLLQATMKLRPDVTSFFSSEYDLSHSGFEISESLDLPPGEYELAIILRGKSGKEAQINTGKKVRLP